jgi:hypothetical protein
VPPAGRAPWLRGQIAGGSAPKPARLASLRRPCGRMGRPPGSEGRRSVVKPERPAPVAERGAPGWPDATGGGGRPAGRGSVPGPWGGLRRARGGIGRGVAGGTDPRHGRSATAWPDRRHAIGFGGRHRCLATVLDMVSRGPPGSIEHAASSVSCERRGYGQPPSRPSPPDGVQAAGHHPGCAVGRTVRGPECRPDRPFSVICHKRSWPGPAGRWADRLTQFLLGPPGRPCAAHEMCRLRSRWAHGTSDGPGARPWDPSR